MPGITGQDAPPPVRRYRDDPLPLLHEAPASAGVSFFSHEPRNQPPWSQSLSDAWVDSPLEPG